MSIFEKTLTIFNLHKTCAVKFLKTLLEMDLKPFSFTYPQGKKYENENVIFLITLCVVVGSRLQSIQLLTYNYYVTCYNSCMWNLLSLLIPISVDHTHVVAH